MLPDGVLPCLRVQANGGLPPPVVHPVLVVVSKPNVNMSSLFDVGVGAGGGGEGEGAGGGREGEGAGGGGEGKGLLALVATQ